MPHSTHNSQGIELPHTTKSRKMDHLTYGAILNTLGDNSAGSQGSMRGASKEQRKMVQEYSKAQTVIVPTRVLGKQTSLAVRTSVAALHCMITANGVKDYRQYLTDTVYRICKSWYGEDGKGLSGFVQDMMIRECFDQSELVKYDYIIRCMEDVMR